MRMPAVNFGSIGTIGDAVMATLSRLSFYWPLSWRGLSALILGVLLANWFWVLFAPHATFTAAVPERAAGLEAGRLFGVVQSSDPATQGVALPNVQLLGVFSASAGRPGFAVLKLDDKRQVGVVEGKEVASGTKLLEVHADYVLLEHAGVQQKVNLENKYAGSSVTGSQPASGAAVTSQNNDITKNDVQNRLRQLSK
jgi:type II secretory pathway component PulC